MSDLEIHHIGIVVENMRQSIDIYEQLGYLRIDDIINDYVQNNNLMFMKNDHQLIELIEPANNMSTVNNTIGYHHICYEVQDLKAFCMQFKSKKLGIIFTNELIAPAFNNRKIVFAYIKNGTIIEFLEAER